MQATVKYQIKSLGEEGLSEGDVILCNHPKAGGSHLPDLTVITPVSFVRLIFVFFVLSLSVLIIYFFCAEKFHSTNTKS